MSLETIVTRWQPKNFTHRELILKFSREKPGVILEQPKKTVGENMLFVFLRYHAQCRTEHMHRL